MEGCGGAARCVSVGSLALVGNAKVPPNMFVVWDWRRARVVEVRVTVCFEDDVHGLQKS